MAKWRLVMEDPAGQVLTTIEDFVGPLPRDNDMFTVMQEKWRCLDVSIDYDQSIIVIVTE